MRPFTLLLVATLLMAFQPVQVQHQHGASDAPAPRWVTRYAGGGLPVSTRNTESQRLFDQGLLLVYAFNHDAAARAFEHAARLDPQLGMAHWGVALAMGAYINGPFTDERYARGRAALLRAAALDQHMTPRERAYVDAMRQRYDVAERPDYLHQQQRYAAAAKLLSDRYPDDLDAATLAAEARMTLNPWRLWNEDGRAADGTAEIVATLESVLARDPDHVGANHLLIHALEASPQPGRALAAAMRLDALELDAGHLAHMPGHIYMRVGDYGALVRSNRAAARVDEAFLEAEGVAPGKFDGYHLHNLDFVVVGETERGNYDGAREAMRRYDAVARRLIERQPGAEYLLARKGTVLLRFNQWDAVLAQPLPPPSQPVSHAYFQYARGVAFAGLGRLDEARAARRALARAISVIPAGTGFRGNAAAQVFGIASHVLDARIALAGPRQADAMPALASAVALQDGLRYEEPPSWDFPVRELLGAARLRNGDASGAEAAFREGLIRSPRHPRMLAGLRDALHAQGRSDDAALVDEQHRKAWAGTQPVRAIDL